LSYISKQPKDEESNNPYQRIDAESKGISEENTRLSSDSRCIEKVEGKGQCMAILYGVEFNQTKNKCELIQTGGCSVSGPFISTNYQDSGSQEEALRLCREICE